MRNILVLCENPWAWTHGPRAQWALGPGPGPETCVVFFTKIAPRVGFVHPCMICSPKLRLVYYFFTNNAHYFCCNP